MGIENNPDWNFKDLEEMIGSVKALKMNSEESKGIGPSMAHVAQISRLYHCDQRRVREQSRKTRLRDDLRSPGVRIFDSETVLSELGRIGSH